MVDDAGPRGPAWHTGRKTRLALAGALSVATTFGIVRLADGIERHHVLPSAPNVVDKSGAVPVMGEMAARAVTEPPRLSLDGQSSVRLLSFIATRSRMLAERDGATRLKLPAQFSRTSRLAMQIAANEQRLLDARRLAFESRQRDLRSKIAIVREEIAGFEKQRFAKEKEIGLISEELGAIQKLHTRQLTNIARLMSLKREETRALWDIGSLDAAVARSHLTIKDIETQIHEERHNVVVDAEREIRGIDMEIGSLVKSEDEIPGNLIALAAEVTRNRKPR